MRWAVWPQISGDSPDARATPFEVTFEVKFANVCCFNRCLIRPLHGFSQGAGPLGIDLIFPFVKSVTPGGMADLLGLRPSLVITHIEDEPMENRNSEEAFAIVRKTGRPLRMRFREVPSPWSAVPIVPIQYSSDPPASPAGQLEVNAAAAKQPCPSDHIDPLAAQTVPQKLSSAAARKRAGETVEPVSEQSHVPRSGQEAVAARMLLESAGIEPASELLLESADPHQAAVQGQQKDPKGAPKKSSSAEARKQAMAERFARLRIESESAEDEL